MPSIVDFCNGRYVLSIGLFVGILALSFRPLYSHSRLRQNARHIYCRVHTSTSYADFANTPMQYTVILAVKMDDIQMKN